ncbi:MAG: hypothetical protein GIKADHBN_00447 [Phycisphaerales bacterium]|nr:hypothetical protein [Phycisphaerales bacterium]
MKPDARFLNQPKHFWANVRSVSQHVGYTARGTGQILVPDMSMILKALRELSLGTSHIVGADGKPTEIGASLVAYFAYRAELLNKFVQPRLMNAEQAAEAFAQVQAATKSRLPIPMNKQKGEKKQPAYLTAMVAMLIDANIEGLPCDYDPRELTTFTQGGAPLRTLARRVDGAFPSAKNPLAVWEIKEYYYTTTFGSRVADGVYETLLDGMELEEMRASEKVDCKHYLMIDAHYTWWDCGRSYLCRIVDMLHMGYVDEVLVGKEVVDRMPELAREWVALHKAREALKR